METTKLRTLKQATKQHADIVHRVNNAITTIINKQPFFSFNERYATVLLETSNECLVTLEALTDAVSKLEDMLTEASDADTTR